MDSDIRSETDFDIVIKKDIGKLRITPVSRKGRDWMKRAKVSYRANGQWDPLYSSSDAELIGDQALADGVTVGVSTCIGILGHIGDGPPTAEEKARI